MFLSRRLLPHKWRITSKDSLIFQFRTVALQQDTGLEGLHGALDLRESLPMSMVDTTGWPEVFAHAYIHFHGTVRFSIISYSFLNITDSASLSIYRYDDKAGIHAQ